MVLPNRRMPYLYDWSHWRIDYLSTRATRAASSRECACVLLAARCQCRSRSLKEQRARSWDSLLVQRWLQLSSVLGDNNPEVISILRSPWLFIAWARFVCRMRFFILLRNSPARLAASASPDIYCRIQLAAAP